MGKFIDLTGERFGRLVVVSKSGTNRYRAAMWLCKCDCGKTVIKRGSALRANHAKSCGCLHGELSALRMTEQNKTHDMSKTRLYKIWTDMKKRCNNKHHWAFARYGGRGIKVCEEWHTFLPFYEWATANGYSDSLTIDRVDNDGDYTPDNCCWVTRKAQANNKSNNILCEIDGEKFTLSQLSEKSGISHRTLYSRICNYGWSVEKAVSTPVRGGGRKHGITRLPD